MGSLHPAGGGPAGRARGRLLSTPAVVIVGLMGSGKTTVGRLVARRTGRTFIDADDAIQALTGRTVRELWEEGGEKAYRELESRVVLEGLEGGDGAVLIAAPGGSVLDPDVRAALHGPGVVVVWLHTEPSAIAERLHPGDHRPLLGEHPDDVLQQMEHERASIYAGVADAVIDTEGKDPDTVAEEVMAAIAGTGSG